MPFAPSLLPPSLQRDLSLHSLESLQMRLNTIDLSPTVLYDFAQVHPSALVHLAEQFNVLGDAGWELADNDDKKRALLLEAIALHKRKGTPYAVKRALQLLGVNATLTEWFAMQPLGTPHTFVVDAQVTEQPADAPAINPLRSAQIQRVIRYWKPARSHFQLRLGIGMRTSLRMASVFSATQWLASEGSLLPLEIAASSNLRVASVFSTSQLMLGDGTLSA